MKKFLAIMFVLIACNTEQKDVSQQAAKEILQAEKDMNDLALKEGFHKALIFYADDSVVKPQDGELPVIGNAALEKYWADKADTKEISWQPFKAEASKSGDLGYTLGNWKFVSKDTVMYGNYYTVWKKQKDGKWKFTVDGGNNTPAPQ
jgi:ketosteroid isomerase-like protein